MAVGRLEGIWLFMVSVCFGKLNRLIMNLANELGCRHQSILQASRGFETCGPQSEQKEAAHIHGTSKKRGSRTKLSGCEKSSLGRCR